MNINEPLVINAETRFNVLPKRLVDSFPPAVATPNVDNVEVFRTLNAGAVTVTSFLKGASGQSINLKGDGFTTIANNAVIKTSTGANKLLSANLIYRFTNIDNIWYEDADVSGGGGGGGISFPYIHTGSYAGVAFDIINTNAAAYGLKIRSNDSSISTDKYAFSVKIYDDSKRSFTVYAEDYIAQIGPTPPAIQWYTAGVAPAAASGGTSGYTRANRLLITSYGDDSGITLISNTTLDATYTGGNQQQINIGLVGANSQGKIRMNLVTASSDGGLRIQTNVRQNWTQADTNRGSIKWGTDSGGKFFGINFMQPGDSTYNPVTAWGDDNVERDFQLFIWPGGNNTTSWGNGKYVEIGTVKVSKGMDFVTQTTTSYDYTTVLPVARCHPGSGGTAGAFEALQELRIVGNVVSFGAADSAGAGYRQVRVPN